MKKKILLFLLMFMFMTNVSALTFNDLKNRRLMDVKFDWDSALSFDGATGPYVQNAHVRLCSIMRKAGYSVKLSEVNFSELTDDYEIIKVGAANVDSLPKTFS